MQNQTMDAMAIINDWAVITSHNRLAGVSQVERSKMEREVEITNIVGGLRNLNYLSRGFVRWQLLRLGQRLLHRQKVLI